MDIVDLANQQIQLVILNALNCLTQISSSSKNSHQVIPYCSIPTTKIDFGQYQTSRLFDIQYSFSLQQSWLTKKQRQQQSQMISLQNFVDGFVENLIQSAVAQIKSEEPMQTIHSYADRFIQSTITQAIETVHILQIEDFSIRLTEDVICDALATIVDDELYSKWRSIDEEDKSNTFEEEQINSSNNNEQSIDSLVNNLAQQIYRCSFDNLRQILTIDNN